MRKPTADDVRRTYERFPGPWDFEKQGRLRLPLVWETWAEAANRINGTDQSVEIEPIRVVEIRMESGTLDGRKAKRLVATLNNPKIEVVLDAAFSDDLR